MLYVICFCSKITEVRTFCDLIYRCFNGYWSICFEWDNNLQPTCLIAPPRKSSLESKIHKNTHRHMPRPIYYIIYLLCHMPRPILMDVR